MDTILRALLALPQLAGGPRTVVTGEPGPNASLRFETQLVWSDAHRRHSWCWSGHLVLPLEDVELQRQRLADGLGERCWSIEPAVPIDEHEARLKVHVRCLG